MSQFNDTTQYNNYQGAPVDNTDFSQVPTAPLQAPVPPAPTVTPKTEEPKKQVSAEFDATKEEPKPEGLTLDEIKQDSEKAVPTLKEQYERLGQSVFLTDPKSDAAIDAWAEDLVKLRQSNPDIDRDMNNIVQSFSDALGQRSPAAKFQYDSLKAVENVKEKLIPGRQLDTAIADQWSHGTSVKSTGTVINLNDPRAITHIDVITGGVRRIRLLNSGFYINIKDPRQSLISEFTRNVLKRNDEYGHKFGGFYYMYADVYVTSYVMNNLLPAVITGSNYEFFDDKDKLLSAISFQDYHTILWGLLTFLFPDGIPTKLLCTYCRDSQETTLDATLLRYIDSNKVTPEILEWFRTHQGKLNDEDLNEFRKIKAKAPSFGNQFDFNYKSGGCDKHVKVSFREISIADYIAAGTAFIENLEEKCDLTKNSDVEAILGYSAFRAYRPWIDSMEIDVLRKDLTGDIVQSNTYKITREAPEANMNALLEDFQGNKTDMQKVFEQYLNNTKLSYYAYRIPECPKCHQVPENTVEGFLPYDPVQSFFMLAYIHTQKNRA